MKITSSSRFFANATVNSFMITAVILALEESTLVLDEPLSKKY